MTKTANPESEKHLWDELAALWPTLLFFAAIFFLCSILFYRQIYQIDRVNVRYVSDLPDHIKFAALMRGSQFSLPHPGFHVMILLASALLGISLEWSSILVLSGLVVFLSMIVFFVLYNGLRNGFQVGVILLLTGALMLVTAVYAPFFNQSIYLGQGSPNLWHNPTIIAVKPFAFLSVLFFVRLVENKTSSKSVVALAALTSFTLLVSTFIKPNFVLIFGPSIFLYVLYKNFKDWTLYWKLLVVMLPAVIALGYQFTMTFLSGTDVQAASVIVDFFGVWQLFSPNVFVSVILALAFPLSLAVFRFREMRQNDYLVLAWFLVIMGILQFGFLAESGERYRHANWSWGYNIALQILFVFSALDLFRWLKEVSFMPKSKGEIYKIASVVTIFSLHLVSGCYYFLKLLGGGSYS